VKVNGSEQSNFQQNSLKDAEREGVLRYKVGKGMKAA